MNSNKNPVIRASEIETLNESIQILQEHIAYLRTLIHTKDIELKRNDDLLNFYINALTEKDVIDCPKLLDAFSLN